jgi:hypothetical protein
MNAQPNVLERLEFDTAELVSRHLPRFALPQKQLVYALACPPERPHAGRIHYSRWDSAPLPDAFDWSAHSCQVEGRQDLYDYAPSADPSSAMEWHVNFADPELFVAYGSELFAQDEMQVMEHPALGSIREALDSGGHAARTVEHGRPTPTLVAGVERRVRIATDPNSAEGRPFGLYGNEFARATTEVIRRAVTTLVPSTISNIIAIAAPRPGLGSYRREEIVEALTAAFTGFSAACRESRRLAGVEAGTIVHTGFWGCGAFGGNRVLMPYLQILAAGLAGLHRLVFHTFNEAGSRSLDHAVALGDKIRTLLPDPSVQAVVDGLHRRGFQWGVSDGN